MPAKIFEQMGALSTHLASRRNAILSAWRDAAEADVEQTTVSVLTRVKFNDHIPLFLDAFESKLRALPGGSRAAKADQAKTRDDVKHGLQRWQQGYQLGELLDASIELVSSAETGTTFRVVFPRQYHVPQLSHES